MVPAEKAIHVAMQEVEKAGADTRLTNAVVKLSEAKDWVSDFVDGIVKESTFKSRLIEEKAQLDERLQKLTSFQKSENFGKIDVIQQRLLNIQCQAMATYSQCLLERLTALPSE